MQPPDIHTDQIVRANLYVDEHTLVSLRVCQSKTFVLGERDKRSHPYNRIGNRDGRNHSIAN